MNNIDGVTYTLFFGIIPNSDGGVDSVKLSYVWDSNEGKMATDFVPDAALMNSAEEQLKEMNWSYALDDNGNVMEESGYCYYYSAKPNEVVCSNNLSR